MRLPTSILRRAAQLAAVICVARPLAAQRPEPRIVDYGVQTTGEVVHGRLVQWGDWGVRTDGCSPVATGGSECVVAVLNGTPTVNTLCLAEAAVVFRAGTDSTKLVAVRPADVARDGYLCTRVAPHTEVTHAFRTPSAIRGNPTAVAITLREALKDGSTVKARARLPLTLSRP